MAKREGVIKYFKDALFPVRCLNCKKEGGWVCRQCFSSLDCCGFCMDGHWSVTKYHDDQLIGKMIRSFKYNYVQELSDVFKDMIELFLKNNLEVFKNVDHIVPVPLHRKRLAERGFNQSEIIANILSDLINKPVKCVLTRKNDTKHQARLGKEERLVNVKNAFTLNQSVFGNALLVDDVYTTGSTIRECKNELLLGGVRSVVSFTIARG